MAKLVSMRQLVILFCVVLISSLAAAQGVVQSTVTPEDVLMIFDDLNALEVAVPEGAEYFSLSFGNLDSPTSYSGSLSPFRIERLRIVTGFPDGVTQDLCEDPAEDAAIALLQELSDGERGSHHRSHVCLAKVSRPAGEYWIVLEQDDGPRLDVWTPLYLHAAREVTSSGDEEFTSRLTPPDSWYFMQIRFLDQAHFSREGRVSNLDDLRHYPRVAELLDEYDAARQ